MLRSSDYIVGTAITGVLYLACIAIYRLYFHPLAKFPGPKLVALTQWPEFYWDAIQRGQFVFHIKAMHEKYGRAKSQPSSLLTTKLFG